MPSNQKLQASHLLSDKINSDRYGSLATRVEFAWATFNSNTTPDYKKAAWAFLRKTFKAERLETVVALYEQLKMTSVVPSLNGFRIEMPKIELLKEPEPPFDIKSLEINSSVFCNEINEKFSVINKLIEEYNTEKKEQQRLEKLNALYLEQKKLMHTTPPKAIALFPAYIEQMLDQFFKALKDQFTSLGIDSLSETTKPDPTLIGSLPEIIANMPPEKIDRLLSILSQGELWKINQLQQLYEPYEIEYDEYQEFLKSHTISFLGGGNSKNFKVTNTLTGKIFILKVDERLGTIKTAEMYLRERSLKNVLTKVYAERSGKILNAEKKNVVKTLIVTDFCQGSDLESLAEQTLSDEKRLELALIIYSQMATILTNIVNDGNAFPDMKNANWLIENDSLFIADCKSFVFINNQHEINFNLPQNRFLGYISTKFLNPPEKWPLIADSLHAYMFGKNLYQFLTNCTQDYLKSVVDQTHFCYQ